MIHFTLRILASEDSDLALSTLIRSYDFKSTLSQPFFFEDRLLRVSKEYRPYDALMAELTISEVSSQVGLAPSAIRYYERIGLLPRVHRVSGQRRYDFTVLNQLAVLQRARRLGFNLNEIRELLLSSRQGDRASERWKKSAQAKLAQLDKLAEEIQVTRRLLHRITEKCHCETLDQCGSKIRESDRCSASLKRTPGRHLGGSWAH